MMYYAILILSLLILAILSYKKIDLALGIVILTLPFYLIRLEILSIPTTVLELMIYAVFLVWIAVKINKKLSLKCHYEKPSRATRQSRDLIKSSGLLRFVATSLAMTKKKFSFPIFLILLGCIISIIVSPNKQEGMGILKGWFIDPLLLFLIISNVIKTKKQIIKILSFLAASGIIAAVVGFFYYFFNELTYDGRLKAFFLSPNHLAMYLAPAGIITLGLFLNFKKYFYFLGFIICSIAIFLTYSYGAWLGFGAGVLFLIFFSFELRNVIASETKRSEVKRGNPVVQQEDRDCPPLVDPPQADFVVPPRNDGKKKVLLLIIISLFLSTVFFSQRNTEKFQNLDNFSRSSFESRIIIWKSSAAILKDHPFWGIGPGNFQNFYLDYQKKFPPYLEWAVPQPHNLFLAFYLQCGLLGLIGFLWIIFLFFKKGFFQLSTFNFQLSTILLAVMIYILIHGLVDTPYWKNDLAIIFWIVIGLMKVIQDSKLNSNIQSNSKP